MDGGRKRLRNRCFKARNPINPATDYHVEWSDLRFLLTEIADHFRWLLISGPWQSGKTSLMYALSDAAECHGYHPVVTTLRRKMVAAANDASQSDIEASNAFFELVADDLASKSRGTLRRGSRRGAAAIEEMLSEHQEREIIWFVDDAALLNDIRRTRIIQTFLSELRMLKQNCASRFRGIGGYYLRSFVLVGTPRLTQLIGDIRIARVTDDYVPSSPLLDTDNSLGNSIAPLNLERHREADALSVQDIVHLLTEYKLEHPDAYFRLQEGPGASDWGTSDCTAAIHKFSKSIWGLTGGHKGMVCTCCVFLVDHSDFTYNKWKRLIRLGHVAEFVFDIKGYSRVVSKVASYPECARQVVLACILTDADSVSVDDFDVALSALDDGVLKRVGERGVALTCPLLLSAFLEDCSFSHPEALPKVDTFLEVIQCAFGFINHERIMRPEALDANKQPSDYTWQTEFLLALKFVLEHGYTISVEAKSKEKNGQRRKRLDFLLKNQASPSKGFEIQGAGNRSSIVKHMEKCVRNGKLHTCEMHYVYLQCGSYGVEAKPIIEEQAPKVPEINCWFVEYVPDVKEWKIEQLVKTGEHVWEWKMLRKPAAVVLPRFMFQRKS